MKTKMPEKKDHLMQLGLSPISLKNLICPHYFFMTKRYALRDDQWEQIKDLLPGRASTV